MRIRTRIIAVNISTHRTSIICPQPILPIVITLSIWILLCRTIQERGSISVLLWGGSWSTGTIKSLWILGLLHLLLLMLERCSSRFDKGIVDLPGNF